MMYEFNRLKTEDKVDKTKEGLREFVLRPRILGDRKG